jgi:predicted nucleic acid-binding protein
MRRVLDADVLIGALDSGDAHHARARKLFAHRS